ncbi:MAG: response regulator [Desulfuromonadales bacterium]|nr:MAG: response regulator [Desulfuromonadales bacterium]
MTIPEEETGAIAPPNTKGHILIVDDDRNVISFLRLALENDGYTISCAECGKQALEMLTKRSFAVMVTDLNMPGMDGFELALLAHGIRQDLTIFMGTGHQYPGIHEQAASVGIRKVFSKPLDFEQLQHALREASMLVVRT